MLDLEPMQLPPDDIASKYGLHPLLRGDLDLSIINGQLASTVDFDAKLGDDQQNALSRLVRIWRFNEPVLRVAFTYVMAAFEREKALSAELNLLEILTDRGKARWHAIQDEIGILSFSRDAYAGTIMVMLANLLHRLRVDLGLASPRADKKTPVEWYGSAPFFAGHSLGAILDAGAANFRHHDEWARAVSGTQQQMNSISIIGDVLGKPVQAGGVHWVRGNECPEVLSKISGGSYEEFNSRFFQFVRSLSKV